MDNKFNKLMHERYQLQQEFRKAHSELIKKCRELSDFNTKAAQWVAQSNWKTLNKRAQSNDSIGTLKLTSDDNHS